MQENAPLNPEKEVAKLKLEMDKLEKNLGIKDMDRLPSCVFVVDQCKEHQSPGGPPTGIPIVGIVDTNCDRTVDFIIRQ